MNASTSPSVCVSAGGKSQRSSGSSSSSTPKSTPATDSSRVSPISSYSSYCPPSAQPSAYPSASPSTSTSPAEISRSSPVLSYPSDSLPSSQHSTLTRRAVEDDLYGDVLVKSVWERMLEIRKEEAASNKLTEKDYQFLSTVGYFEVEEGQVPRKSLKYCRNATDCHSF
ncbi:hypothetical protein GYMLUDRAFT_947683 [Collybiopsis luxurians FD-317 M1]|uniref:Uncharacterized protein n=1 Tax=Collybiopsis luxurians FD-317 M1 TaxID=944289 RepID=A0A0D0C4W6_9AGAR|nr:hypothetical protein GYMLUDRAFT_947683 [Collybiopsis luxurians FD-317 M1]